MIEYYKLALSRFTDFSGRSRRSEFWYFVLGNFLIGIVLAILDNLLGFGKVGQGMGVFGGLFNLIILVPSIAVSVRRLHDVGKSGWWLLIMLVPVIGFIILLYFYVLDSEPHENNWGPNPKEVDNIETKEDLV